MQLYSKVGVAENMSVHPIGSVNLDRAEEHSIVRDWFKATFDNGRNGSKIGQGRQA